MDSVTLEGLDPGDLIEMGQALITAGILLRYCSEGDEVDDAQAESESRAVLNDTVRTALEACGVEVN